MAKIASLGITEEIKDIVASGGFQRDVSKYLKTRFPEAVGISERSVRRFCSDNGLKRFSCKQFDKKTKENAVRKAAKEVIYCVTIFASDCISQHCYNDALLSSSCKVGACYGGGTIQGYLRSKGINVSVRKINSVLKEMDPDAFEARRNDTVDRTNPVPYKALYFGYKGHIDQNEKLVRYGVVHAVLRDGYSGAIESWVTLPSKNPIQLYKLLYR